MTERNIKRQERMAKIQLAIAARSSRNKSILDRLCRMLMLRITSVPPDKDFMRDSFIDEDQGFDPDELERYQNGES